MASSIELDVIEVLIYVQRAILLIIVGSLLLSSQSVSHEVDGPIYGESLTNDTTSVLTQIQLIDYDPISIQSNGDFESQGWSGTGTQDDPYIIENLRISSNSVCIAINNTDVYHTIFRVENL